MLEVPSIALFAKFTEIKGSLNTDCFLAFLELCSLIKAKL